jgi:hypothetical protein
LRTRVLALLPVFNSLRDLGSSLISKEDAPNARERILFYFRKYPFTIIAHEEIMVVSGISDYARRLRELRVQLGWWIYSGKTFKQIAAEGEPEEIDALAKILSREPSKIKPDEYVLMRVEEDRDASHRWNLSNTIRKKKIGVKAKILEYMLANVGKVISGEELRYLAKDKKEWPRRTRELRTEDGWPVATKMSGRPDLAVGAYVLEDDRQAEPHDRDIPDIVRVQVLERDHHACTECGWTRDKLAMGDPRKILELHHRTHHVDKGANTAANLKTMCNVCHDDAHRKTHARAD